jgi:hypothetical protein
VARRRWRLALRARVPAAEVGRAQASGSNFKRLGISSLDSTSSGRDGLAATPAPNAVTVAFSAPPAGSDIVGPPTLKFTHKGNARSPHTFLFAQILDARANRVIGSQVTPLPVVLDGRVRTVERDLEPIAAHAGPGGRYRVQITAPASSARSTPSATPSCGRSPPRCRSSPPAQGRAAHPARAGSQGQLTARRRAGAGGDLHAPAHAPVRGHRHVHHRGPGPPDAVDGARPGFVQHQEGHAAEHPPQDADPRRRAVQRQQRAAGAVGEDRVARRAVIASVIRRVAPGRRFSPRSRCPRR